MSSVSNKWVAPSRDIPYASGQMCHNATGAAAIVANALVVVNGRQGVLAQVTNADANGAAALRDGKILVAKHAIPANREGVCLPWRVVRGVNTGAGAADDPVFLSETAGGWTLPAPASNVIQVGQVLFAHATAGVILLAPEAYAKSATAGVPFKLPDDTQLVFGDGNDWTATFRPATDRLELFSVATSDIPSSFLDMRTGNVEETADQAGVADSGDILVASGTHEVSGAFATNAGTRSGNLAISSGDTDVTAAGTGAVSGAVSLSSGATDCNDAGGTGGASGAATLSTGNAAATVAGTSGASGAVTVSTGTSVDGNTGAIRVTTGASTSGNSGGVTVTTGTAASGTRGVITLDGRQVVHPMGTLDKRVGGIVDSATAAATRAGDTAGPLAFTNGIVTFPANTLRIGDVVRVKYYGRIDSLADAGTETVQIQLLLDGDTLMDHTVAAMTDNDEFFGEYELTVRTLAAGGTAAGWGTFTIPAAIGGPPAVQYAASAALTPDNVGVTTVLSLSVTWAGAGITAADVATLETFTVEVL